MHWDDVGHFYPGDPGIAREVAKSKQELLNQRLGGGWGLGAAVACQRSIISRDLKCSLLGTPASQL